MTVTITGAAFGSLDAGDRSLYDAFQGLDVLSESNVQRGIGGLQVSHLSDYEFLSSMDVGLGEHFSNFKSLDITSGDSFMMLIDVIQQELSGTNSGTTHAVEINAVFKVNNVEVPIKDFSFQRPTGKLGSILNVTLADPDPTIVPVGASIKFQLEVNGEFYTLLDNGKIQEKDYSVTVSGGGPDDEVTVGSLDVMADKFTLAPRRPVIMYDPSRVDFSEVKLDVDNMPRDRTGKVIRPVIEPVSGLTMKQILLRAYTGAGGGPFVSFMPHVYYLTRGWSNTMLHTPGNDQIGCDFSGVVTNIPNYRVKRADFSITGGWHDGAQPVVAMFNPLYFTEVGSLFIIDVDRPLNYGINPKQIPLSEHKSLSERISYRPDSNAVLLTYQYSADDPNENPRRMQREVILAPEREPQGTEGQPGFVETTTRRTVIEFFMADEPDTVIASLDKRIEITTEQTVSWPIYNPGTETILDTVVQNRRVTQVETINNIYEGDLKVGHTREIQSVIKIPSEHTLELIVAERTSGTIHWVEDPLNPGTKIQAKSREYVEGLCYYAVERETLNDGGEIEIVRRYPMAQAEASGLVVEGEVTLDIHNMVPLRTTIQTLRLIKSGQYDVEQTVIDHLNNKVSRSFVEPTTGSSSANTYETRSREVLFRDYDSEAEIGPRIPTGLNSYELPREMAYELAERTLRRLSDPLMTQPMTLPGVDFSLSRGSVVTGEKRSGYGGIFIVTGDTIVGQNLGRQGHRIFQTLETLELLSQ